MPTNYIDGATIRGTDYDLRDADAQAKLETKAEIDGYYEEMSVGDAEQLIATQFVEDSEPYKFRTTGGSADVGNRAYADKIVGGTIAWNQLLPIPSTSKTATVSGVTVTDNRDGSYTLNGTATTVNANVWLAGGYGSSAVSYILNLNHIYFIESMLFFAHSTNSGSISFTAQTPNSPVGTARLGKIINANYIGNAIRLANFEEKTYSNQKIYPQYIDLTQMFGSDIADAIYAAEQANAGAGVAWFRALFPEPYYAYNVGELISVSGLQSHDTVGFNQWDEEWENGLINLDTGLPASNASYFRSKNFDPCVPSVVYHVKKGDENITQMIILFYDADKNYISYTNTSATSGKATSPSNARYFKVRANVSAYTGALNVNLSWSGTRNGEYEPYVKHTYPLDSSLTLRGIPKWVDGKLTFDGDEYLPDGTVTRRYGIVDLGTLNWTYDPSNNRFTSGSLFGLYNWKGSRLTQFVSDYYTILSNGESFDINSDKVLYSGGTDQNILAQNHAYTTAADFKTAMSGVMLVYELATPTEETAEPYNAVQIVEDFGTEEYISGTIVPVGHATRYPANLRDKLQHLPDLASGNGIYAIQQTGSQMTLTPLTTPTELPTAPTTDGTYKLKVTVSNGTPTYAWESEG